MSEAIFQINENQKGKTKAEVRHEFSLVVQNAASRAITKTIGELLPDVAFKTGRMRAAFEMAINRQFISQAGNSKINIEFNEAKFTQVMAEMFRGLNYIQHHWGGAPRTGATYYQKPNIPGTRPIMPREWSAALKRWFIVEFKKEASSRGFRVT